METQVTQEAVKIREYKYSDIAAGKDWETPYRWGYLYAFEVPGGRVKIGKTKNPKNRLSNHHNDLLKFSGDGLTSVWITDPHSNYSDTELIAHSLLSHARVYKEFFKCGISDAIEQISNITFEYIEVDRLKESEESKEKTNGLIRSFVEDGRDVAIRQFGETHVLMIDILQKATSLIHAYFCKTNPHVISQDKLASENVNAFDSFGLGLHNLQLVVDLMLKRFIDCGIEKYPDEIDDPSSDSYRMAFDSFRHFAKAQDISRRDSIEGASYLGIFLAQRYEWINGSISPEVEEAFCDLIDLPITDKAKYQFEYFWKGLKGATA